MVDNYQKVLSDIYEQFNFVKTINFSEDIDTENSCYYQVDKDMGSLEILISEVNKICLDDYIKVFGELILDNSGVIVKPTVNQEFGDISYVSASLFVDKYINTNKNSMIVFNFERQNGSFLLFRLCNKHFQQIMQRIISGKAEYGKAAFSDKVSQTLDLIFSDSGLTIIPRIGIELQQDSSILMPLQSNIVEMSINIKHNYLIINGKKFRVPLLSAIDDDYTGINIISFIKQAQLNGEIATIRELSCGRAEGFVRLKDISLEGRTAQVLAIYKGNPELQYYDFKDNCWQIIKQNQTIDVEKALRLRIRMGVEDQVLKVIIVEPK